MSEVEIVFKREGRSTRVCVRDNTAVVQGPVASEFERKVLTNAAECAKALADLDIKLARLKLDEAAAQSMKRGAGGTASKQTNAMIGLLK